MSDRTACVYVDLDGEPVLVGTLHARFRKNRESATFTYDASWLSHPVDLRQATNHPFR